MTLTSATGCSGHRRPVNCIGHTTILLCRLLGTKQSDSQFPRHRVHLRIHIDVLQVPAHVRRTQHADDTMYMPLPGQILFHFLAPSSSLACRRVNRTNIVKLHEPNARALCIQICAELFFYYFSFRRKTFTHFFDLRAHIYTAVHLVHALTVFFVERFGLFTVHSGAVNRRHNRARHYRSMGRNGATDLSSHLFHGALSMKNSIMTSLSLSPAAVRHQKK